MYVFCFCACVFIELNDKNVSLRRRRRFSLPLLHKWAMTDDVHLHSITATCGVANNAVNSFTNAAGTYIAEWQIVDQFITITFQGQTPTTGWLGFGINGQNQMPGGDVVVGKNSCSPLSFFFVGFSDITESI